MATLAFTNAKVIVNATDISSFVKSVALNVSSNLLDNTAMGATYMSRIGGLKDADLAVTPNQDFVAAGIDVTIWPLVGTTSCWEIRPINACSTAINPIYSGVFLIDKYTPLSGQVGSLLPAPFSAKISGTLSRASSS